MIPVLKTIIDFATKAASSHNTQPWKFTVEGHYIKLYPDFTRSLPVADADRHELYISIGCALENLIIAATQFGYKATVGYDLNGNDEHILIHLYEDETCTPSLLYDSILQRHVNRSVYTADEIPDEVLLMLFGITVEKNVEVSIITDQETIKTLADFTEEAALQQYSDPAFKQELLKWMRFNDRQAIQTKDGLRSASVGSPSVAPGVGKFMFEHFVSPRKEAIRAKRLLEKSPMVVLFSCSSNTKENWVKVGQSFERFALAATAYGLAYAPMNMSCEVAGIRKRMKHFLHLREKEPLLLIRVGYAQKTMPPSYRRRVEEIICTETNT
jgi:nitroreductase